MYANRFEFHIKVSVLWWLFETAVMYIFFLNKENICKIDVEEFPSFCNLEIPWHYQMSGLVVIDKF